jgi:hypothetical protein
LTGPDWQVFVAFGNQIRYYPGQRTMVEKVSVPGFPGWKKATSLRSQVVRGKTAPRFAQLGRGLPAGFA